MLLADSFYSFKHLDETIPDHANAKFFLGFLYYINGDLDMAKLYLNQAIVLDPNLITEEVEMVLNAE